MSKIKEVDMFNSKVKEINTKYHKSKKTPKADYQKKFREDDYFQFYKIKGDNIHWNLDDKDNEFLPDGMVEVGYLFYSGRWYSGYHKMTIREYREMQKEIE